MSETDRLRTFIGIPLTEQARRALVSLQDAFRQQLSGDRLVKWERALNLHLTLQFLGDTDREDLDLIGEAISEVAQSHSPFSVTFGEPSHFGGAAPRVLVVTVTDGANALRALQAELARALDELGFHPEGRAYTPHLTIGRVRRGQRLVRTKVETVSSAKGNLIAGTTMSIDEIVHFHSELTPEGANYSRLATIGLAAPRPQPS